MDVERVLVVLVVDLGRADVNRLAGAEALAGP
jgi:hypothetical protein